LGMRTDASSRFEKGLDAEGTYWAVQRACELVELLGCGEVMDGMLDVVAKPQAETVVKLEPEKINRLLGTDIDEQTMRDILLALDFTLDGDEIHVPSWRGDVEHYSDIAEEVARFYGYNEIPDTLMRGQTTRGGFSEIQKFENSVDASCRALGYDEIITYSFISPSYYDKIRLPADSPLRSSLKILNPLGEDTSIMRTTVLPSMLEIVARNFSYRNKAVRLYELGKIYLPRPDGLADEPKVLSLGAYGDGVDFFSFKGDIQAVLDQARVGAVRFEACRDNPSYHPGRCAKVYAGDRLLGVFGQIHPLVAAAYDVDAEIYAAEIDFGALYGARGGQPEYVPLPKYPSVTRDLAVVCADGVTVGQLEDCIRRAAVLVRKIELFDIYTGAPILPGFKSVAFSLELRSDERNLTAAEADEEMARILKALEKEHGAVIR
ncbi:MAG: phenylalanine--tRNA ligase subunit beta, partial [Oscillospiraceae bacterium]|nr:phenylalanine--tRNA ligase subunit beta [Oscillospiraceae bacterium]